MTATYQLGLVLAEVHVVVFQVALPEPRVHSITVHPLPVCPQVVPYLKHIQERCLLAAYHQTLIKVLVFMLFCRLQAGFDLFCCILDCNHLYNIYMYVEV